MSQTYGITNGKVIALRAEDGHQSRPGVVQWSRDEQTNDEHSKEDERLRDQHGQQKGPVDFVPVELHQRQKDQRWQREGANKCGQSFCFRIANDLKASSYIAEGEKGEKVQRLTCILNHNLVLIYSQHAEDSLSRG